MNQEQLVCAIAKKFFLTKTESRGIIKLIIAEITKDLKKGKRAYLRGFGSFTKEKRARKKVRHPKTKKIIIIPERFTVDFNPSNLLLKNLH